MKTLRRRHNCDEGLLKSSGTICRRDQDDRQTRRWGAVIIPTAIEDPVVWEMNAAEYLYLDSLPEVVDLWQVVSEHNTGPYYISRDRGIDGLRAFSYSVADARLKRCATRRAYIVAIDLERCTAQVMCFELDCGEDS